MIKKRKFQAIILLLLVVVAFSIPFAKEPATALANSAAPIPPDGDSGIVFKQHEHVQIQREILDIQINDDTTANIKATYIMKNTSPETLSVETMFISPVEFGDNKNIEIQKNGTELSFIQEFYSSTSYRDIAGLDDWESVLNGARNPSKPLGDGIDFWEYRIRSLDTSELYARFSPSIYYFRESQGYKLSGNQVELRNYKSYENQLEDIIIVSKQDFSPETNGTLIKTRVADIYEYLYERATKDASEPQLRFAQQQFNLYLFNFDTETREQDFFSLAYVDQYIGAIVYFVDFAPNEELELTVSYTYQMGTSGYKRSVELLYYLSPAKYWKNFADIEINLSLSEKYKKIESSTLNFDKINEKNYKFSSASLPDTELRIVVNDGVFFTEGIIFMLIILAAVGLVLIPVPVSVAVIIIVIVKRTRRNKC